MEEIRVAGLEAVELASKLLRRDASRGAWEPADVQWWWRMPRESDATAQRFWLEDGEPVAAFLATEFRGTWQLDALAVPWLDRAPVIDALIADEHRPSEVLVGDDDAELADRLRQAGFVRAEGGGGVSWLDLAERPMPAPLARGFRFVDRRDAVTPHPMRERNGEGIEERLRQTSIYDPSLDLAVETSDGEVAGYALFWHDPETATGMLEPMRVHDAFQRRGLARALVGEGLERLAAAGAQRCKVSFSSDFARALYTGSGFTVTSTDSTWARS